LDDFAFTKLVYPALQPSVKQILDLGCGTGRNTVKLLQRGISIIATDASTAMMNEARIRVAQVPPTEPAIGSVQWLLWDIESGQAPLPEMLGVDAVVSTLVLEHVRLENFFKVIRACLKPGGFAFVTNMHPDLGSRSAAGFVGRNGQKVRGVSYNYGVEETIEAAAGVGLILREEVDVSGVEGEDDVKRFGARARKWVGLKLCVAFLFELRKTDLC
jgi:SAM-dependent methyltransferase